MASRFSKFQTSCTSCGSTTTKSYARANGGKCKGCVTGVQPTRTRRTHDDILREGGYEDTMGVSPDCLESWRNGGDYYGD